MVMVASRIGGARRRGRRAVAVPIALLAAGMLVAGACGSSSDSSRSMSAPAAPAPADMSSGGEAIATGQASGPAAAQQAPSLNTDALTPGTGSFISTATITVQVDDVAGTKPKVIDIAVRSGGALFAEETSYGGRALSKITLKVPPSAFNPVLDQLGRLGVLASQQVRTDDVTQQVIDLDARIGAAAASLDRVRDLLGRASVIGDIIQLEGEVSRRQADLERLRGQQKTLHARIDLATIEVTLDGGSHDATPAELERRREPGLPGFTDGLRGGWEAAVRTATVAGAVVGALLPFLPLLVLAVVAWRWLRRRRDDRTARPVPTMPPPPDREVIGTGVDG